MASDWASDDSDSDDSATSVRELLKSHFIQFQDMHFFCLERKSY